MISAVIRYCTFLAVLLGSVWAQAAEPMVQVELLLFRHTDTPLVASQPPTHTWAEGAKTLTERNEVPSALDDAAAKLTPSQGYRVLLHKAWRQTITTPMVDLAIKNGSPQFEFYPIQGRLRLSFGDQISVDSNLWVNQFDDQGRVTASEHLSQKFKVRANEVRYLDHGSLGLLIKISQL